MLVSRDMVGASQPRMTDAVVAGFGGQVEAISPHQARQ